MRICLVNSRLEGPYPPLGLAYLASYLKKYGQFDCEIKIVDGNISHNIIKEILEFNPEIVGFTALSPQIKGAVALSRELRTRNPEIFQVIGGLHVSADPENTLRRGNFDLAVLGEGEKTFREVVESLKLGKNKAYYGIEGIAFLEGARLVVTSPRKEIEPLDSIPFPERLLLSMKHYLAQYLVIRGLSGDKITTIHTSRGCPYDCIFCSCDIVFKKVRYFAVDYVIAEINELITKYKVKSLFFTDDTFILNKERVKDLSSMLIKEGINKHIKWEVQGRANLIDWEDLSLLKLMKQAGCVQIDYGFETGSEKILKFLKKKDVSIQYNRRAIEVTKSAGLNAMGTFMVGIPGETQEDLELTKNFIIENNQNIDNFQVFIATPYPGAQLYEICKKEGTVEKDYFEQLVKEEDINFIPVYTKSLPAELVIQVQRFLNRLAVKKISLGKKIIWLWFNFIHHPFEAIKKVGSALKQ